MHQHNATMKKIGYVRELVRYPVKSMAGTPIDSAVLGWYGLEGDRRFAFRRLGDESDFPWLSASRMPSLITYHPLGDRVLTPAGEHLELRGAELDREISERHGSPVELMMLKHGIFDAASISVINLATIDGISREAGVDPDRRRFRANIVLDTDDHDPFAEDAWVGGTLLFGEEEPRPAVSVTMLDERCMMLNLDPDTGKQDARMMKTVVRLNGNNAGVYGTVVRTGTIRVGQPVTLVM
jgi:uncharacterized protein YcbX